MSSEELQTSLKQYTEQLQMIKEALKVAADTEKESLFSLESDLQQLIELTKESIEATLSKEPHVEKHTDKKPAVQDTNSELDDEYALFMQEMAKTGAYEENTKQTPECSDDKNNPDESGEESDIEDELATLLGMKCAVYHTHRWGGQPTLYNAMVSTVEPRQDDDQFKDLQVRVLFTHPTHAEMLPCPYFLDGECRFSDEQCRYSHGAIFPLSSLKEAIEPNFESVKIGSRVLVKLKPPEGEDVSLARKSTEKYLLWHRAVVKSIDEEKRTCLLKMEQALNTGEKKKTISDEFTVAFEEIFPLNDDVASDSDSEDSLSDTEYPESKVNISTTDNQTLLIDRSLQTSGPPLGEWERHTRGIGSKLMLAMGYVAGAGLGARGGGRVLPVEARAGPPARSLDHCMEMAEKERERDPLKVEQKLKRMQKKEEERNKRAYEREKERERRNVFNFLNNTLGDKSASEPTTANPMPDIKQSTSKDLNIEQFKINEETKRLEREIVKLNSSLQRQTAGSSGHRGINVQLAEKNKELNVLRNKEKQIAKEQRHRQDKQKMTVF